MWQGKPIEIDTFFPRYISIKQPFAEAILRNVKDIENRWAKIFGLSWKPPVPTPKPPNKIICRFCPNCSKEGKHPPPGGNKKKPNEKNKISTKTKKKSKKSNKKIKGKRRSKKSKKKIKGKKRSKKSKEKHKEQRKSKKSKKRHQPPKNGLEQGCPPLKRRRNHQSKSIGMINKYIWNREMYCIYTPQSGATMKRT